MAKNAVNHAFGHILGFKLDTLTHTPLYPCNMKYVFGLLGAIITILVNIMINIIIIEVEVVVEQ